MEQGGERVNGVVDTHAHYWQRQRGESELIASHDAPVSPGEFLKLMNDSGVANLLQVTRYFDPNDDYSLAGAAEFPDRYRVIGRYRPEFLDEPGLLEGWAARENIIGLRVFSHPVEPRLFTDAAAGFWGALESLAVPVSLYVPGYLREVRDIAVTFPALSIVIDHLGARVFAATPPDERFGDWDEAMALSDVPNVFAKASGMPEGTLEAFPYPDAQARLREIVAAFGADRVMWGSNFTPSRRVGTYRELVQFARLAVRSLSFGDQRAVLRGTAGRFFRIESWLDTDQHP